MVLFQVINKYLHNSPDLPLGQQSLKYLLSGPSHIFLSQFLSMGSLSFQQVSFLWQPKMPLQKQCPLWPMTVVVPHFSRHNIELGVVALCFSIQFLSHIMSHAFDFWKTLISFKLKYYGNMFWELNWHFDVLLANIQLPVFCYCLQKDGGRLIDASSWLLPKPCQWLVVSPLYGEVTAPKSHS